MKSNNSGLFPLPVKEYEICGFDIFETLLDEVLDWPGECMISLDRDDEMQLVRIADDHNRKKFIYKRCFRRSVLTQYLNVEPNLLTFSRSPNGKPLLPNHPHVHFNLTTSGSRILMAVGKSPVGIDLEVFNGQLPSTQLISYLNRYRSHSLEPLPENMQEQEFKSWWSCNEAVQKFLDLDMNSFGWRVPLGIADRAEWISSNGLTLEELPLMGAKGWIACRNLIR